MQSKENGPDNYQKEKDKLIESQNLQKESIKLQANIITWPEDEWQTVITFACYCGHKFDAHTHTCYVCLWSLQY